MVGFELCLTVGLAGRVDQQEPKKNKRGCKAARQNLLEFKPCFCKPDPGRGKKPVPQSL
jgi:hypothetical protein